MATLHPFRALRPAPTSAAAVAAVPYDVINVDEARALVAQPFTAVMLIALVVMAFWHAQLGMQVVFEDYVTPRWREVTMQLLMKAFCFLAAVACILAIVRIALGTH